MIEARNREIRELSLLFEISTKLSESLDLKAVLKPILQLTAEHMDIHRGTLTILNRNKGEIAIEEAYGLRPEEQAKGKYRLGEGVTGRVIDTGQPIVVPNIADEPHVPRQDGREAAPQQERHRVHLRADQNRQRDHRCAFRGDRASGDEARLRDDVRVLTIIASTISQAVRLRQHAEEELGRVRGGEPEPPAPVQDQVRDEYHRRQLEGDAERLRPD